MIQAARIKEDSGKTTAFSLLRIKMLAASDPSSTIELHREYKHALSGTSREDLYFQRDDNFNF